MIGSAPPDLSASVRRRPMDFRAYQGKMGDIQDLEVLMGFPLP